MSLRFPLQPSIYCTVPIRHCISIYMEYIIQVCIWSISTDSLSGRSLHHTFQHLHHWLNQTPSSHASILSLCSYRLLCNCTGAILPVCRYTRLLDEIKKSTHIDHARFPDKLKCLIDLMIRLLYHNPSYQSSL